jgi:glycolate oxidase subunit GlcD
VHRRLGELVGPEHVITDPDRLLVYESDGLTAYRWPPRAVVLPASTAEVAGVMGVLRHAGIPIVPRGAGTGLSGGALAGDGAVVVGTARMTRILSLDPENRIARMQPGVVNTRLSEAARPHGLYYAPDPSSQTACTIGGNVAENSGGPHCLKYGVTSRYITGLTVVLSDGEVVELGGAGADPESGYDLVGAFVGSEGCFGVATEIEVRLLPLPEGVRTLLAIFETLEDAGRAVTAIVGAGLLPAALEIMDQSSIEAVEASVFAAGYPTDAGAALVVEFDGTEAGLEADAGRAEALCMENGAREVRRARNDAERDALWKGRKKAFGAFGRLAPDLIVQDATVPRTKLPEVLARIREIGAAHGLRVANVFHAGDGNLHPKLLFDRRNEEEVARVEAASKEIMGACVAAGGTITGEHGVGVDKRKYMRLVYGPEEIEAMRSVRDVFDPSGLLNPGKVLPEPEGAAAPSPPRRTVATT